jgi:hypothetical protein
MEVFHAINRPVYQSFYEVAGRLLFVESSDQHLAQLIGQLFAGWLLSPVESTNQVPDIILSFHCEQELPTIPLNGERFDIAEGGRCYTVEGGFFLDLNNSLIRLRDTTPVKVDLWIKRVPAEPDANLAHATSFSVCAALRRCGLFELHAAGVVDPVGKNGVLIIGPSGSGKSTLTLQLVKSGWSYLTDDELLLSLTDGGVLARGFRSFFAISEAAAMASGVGDLERSASDFQSRQMKTCFNPEAMFDSGREPVVKPRFLLFTSIANESVTRVKSLGQAEAMARLVRSCPWATYDKPIAQANLQVLSQLAKQSVALNLFAGTDMLDSATASALILNTIQST